MGIVTAEDCSVATRTDGSIVLRVPAGGRDRMVVMKPGDAIRLGTALTAVGADLLPSVEGVPNVADVLMRPFVEGDLSLLRFKLSGEGGELLLAVDAKQLLALSQAAQGALEYAGSAGNA